MSGIALRLDSFLKENGISYELLAHRADYTAREAADDTHTPPDRFAKSVFLCVDGQYAVAVLPASCWVSFRKLREALGAREVRLATEEEVARLCPDCDVGAAHPFGNLYGMPVFVSERLRDGSITFNGGSHDEAVRMAYEDFAFLTQPRVLRFEEEH